MDPNTAMGAYGYQSWTPAFPGGMAIMPETQVGAIGDIPAGALGKLGVSPNGNPLFFLLVLFLIWTGWVYGGFDLGVKNVIRGSARVGR